MPSNSFFRMLVSVIIVVVFFTLLFSMGDVPYDDSDPGNGERSGLVVKTDCLTGLQYLESPFGGLTPRLDATGKQIVSPCK